MKLSKNIGFHQFFEAGILKLHDQILDAGFAPDHPFKQVDFLGSPIINSGKTIPRSNRPHHRIGLEAQFPLQFIHQVQWLAGGTIHLVDESKDRQRPHLTDFK